MRRILLYDNAVTGHHIQYIRYVLDYVSNNPSINVFIVACLPQAIKEHLNISQYETTGKITFLLKDLSTLNYVKTTTESDELQMIHEICEEHELEEVVFMLLDMYFKAIALNSTKRSYR